MNEAGMVAQLIVNSLNNVKHQGVLLQDAQSSTFPIVPKLRSPIRYITDKLGIRWAPKARAVITIEFYERRLPENLRSKVNLGSAHRTNAAQRKLVNSFRHKLRWVEIHEEEFKTRLGQACTTPRLAARVLARMSAYSSWLVQRQEGLAKARTHVLVEQTPWVEALNAKIAGLDLAGSMDEAKLPAAFNHNGPFAAWPTDLRHMVTLNQKIPAIKYLRVLTGFGLADAKNYIERAMSILQSHGTGVFNNNIISFYDWPYH